MIMSSPVQFGCSLSPVEVSKHAGIIELPTAFSERVLLILDFPASSSLSTESSAFFFFAVLDGLMQTRRSNPHIAHAQHPG